MGTTTSTSKPTGLGSIPRPPAPTPVAPPAPPQPVTFRCERWPSVSVHGRGIKFADHLFTTADAEQVAFLDGWAHAERVAK